MRPATKILLTAARELWSKTSKYETAVPFSDLWIIGISTDGLARDKVRIHVPSMFTADDIPPLIVFASRKSDAPNTSTVTFLAALPRSTLLDVSKMDDKNMFTVGVQHLYGMGNIPELGRRISSERSNTHTSSMHWLAVDNENGEADAEHTNDSFAARTEVSNGPASDQPEPMDIDRQLSSPDAVALQQQHPASPQWGMTHTEKVYIHNELFSLFCEDFSGDMRIPTLAKHACDRAAVLLDIYSYMCKCSTSRKPQPLEVSNDVAVELVLDRWHKDKTCGLWGRAQSEEYEYAAWASTNIFHSMLAFVPPADAQKIVNLEAEFVRLRLVASDMHFAHVYRLLSHTEDRLVCYARAESRVVGAKACGPLNVDSNVLQLVAPFIERVDMVDPAIYEQCAATLHIAHDRLKNRTLAYMYRLRDRKFRIVSVDHVHIANYFPDKLVVRHPENDTRVFLTEYHIRHILDMRTRVMYRIYSCGEFHRRDRMAKDQLRDIFRWHVSKRFAQMLTDMRKYENELMLRMTSNNNSNMGSSDDFASGVHDIEDILSFMPPCMSAIHTKLVTKRHIKHKEMLVYVPHAARAHCTDGSIVNHVWSYMSREHELPKSQQTNPRSEEFITSKVRELSSSTRANFQRMLEDRSMNNNTNGNAHGFTGSSCKTLQKYADAVTDSGLAGACPFRDMNAFEDRVAEDRFGGLDDAAIAEMRTEVRSDQPMNACRAHALAKNNVSLHEFSNPSAYIRAVHRSAQKAK